MQVDGYQRDADQTHMDPPLSHLELSGGGGLIPASERRRQKQPRPGTIPTGEAVYGGVFRGCLPTSIADSNTLLLLYTVIN